MKSFGKVSGYAAWVQAVVYAWFAVFVLFINQPGVTPAQGLAYVRSSPVPLINALAALIFVIADVIVVLALNARLRDSSPVAMRIATAFGLTLVPLFLAFGMVNFYIKIIPSNIADDAAAQSVYSIFNLMIPVVLNSAIFADGVWRLITHWAALSSKRLPAGLSYLGLLTGLQAVITFATPPALKIAAPVLHIVWAAWLGSVLPKESA